MTFGPVSPGCGSAAASGAHACRGQRGLGAGVAATHNNYVKLLGKLAWICHYFNLESWRTSDGAGALTPTRQKYTQRV